MVVVVGSLDGVRILVECNQLTISQMLHEIPAHEVVGVSYTACIDTVRRQQEAGVLDPAAAQDIHACHHLSPPATQRPDVKVLDVPNGGVCLDVHDICVENDLRPRRKLEPIAEFLAETRGRTELPRKKI